jgi:DNA-binding transcriptional LysR family regulator
MDLRHLKSFAALAEELHFGRAAARLGISQPPLSQQILALERELGVALLQRTSRRVGLTEAGRLFLVEARGILARVEHAVAVARRAGRGEIGELRIGFTASAPLMESVPRTIRAFRDARPEVHLLLQELPTRRQVEALVERRLDIGFLRVPGGIPALPAGLLAVELDRDELVAYLRSDHPLAQGEPDERIDVAALASDPFVLFQRDVGAGTYEQGIALCRAAGFTPRLGQEAREAATILGLVSAGLGVALLPESLRRIQVAGITFRRLRGPGVTVATWLAHHRDEASPLVAAFLAMAGPG